MSPSAGNSSGVKKGAFPGSLASGGGPFLVSLFLQASAMLWLFGTLVNRIAFRFNDGPVKSLIFHSILICCAVPLLIMILAGAPALVCFRNWTLLVLICVEVLELRLRAGCFLGNGHSIPIHELRQEIHGGHQAASDEAAAQKSLFLHPGWQVSGPHAGAPWNSGSLLTTVDAVATFHRIPLGWLFGNFRILFLTDLHMGRDQTPDHYFQKISEAVKALDPWIILLGGDFIYRAGGCDELHEFLTALRAPGGVYGIMGNHDYSQGREEVRETLLRAGVINLGGRHSILESPDGKSFILSGNEEPWGPSWRRKEGITSEDKDRMGWISLSHTADNFPSLSQAGADLILSGHFHGGQIRLPLFGSTLVPSLLGRRFSSGLYEMNGSYLVVSRGLGVSGPPLRIMCNPEITVLDLH